MLLRIIGILITPLPNNVTFTGKTFEIGQVNFSCQSDDQDCNKLIQPILLLYTKLIFPVSTIDKIQFDCVININTLITPANFINLLENYTIDVMQYSIIIQAENTFALARALATLSQIVECDYTGSCVINQVNISDSPKFQYRGLMLDTSRHFLKIETILKQIQALSISKMNVLHLHLSDSESFSMKTRTSPGSNLANGQWRQDGRRNYYSLEEFDLVVKTGLELGVFVVFELDVPGHAASWIQASESIVCSCEGHDTINPVSESTYEHIKTYLGDMFQVYLKYNITPMVHLGGDEVQHQCLEDDEAVLLYLNRNNITTKQLWQEIHDKVNVIISDLLQNNIREQDLTSLRLYWQEAFINQNDHYSGGIAQIWKTKSLLAKSAEKKIWTIRSQGWYLDLNKPVTVKENFMDTWEDFYQILPDEGVQSDFRQFILGGEACQWGEKIDDGNIDNNIWPRAAVIGEVLWSDPSDRNITQQLKSRFTRFTCKLRGLGILAGSVQNDQPCPGVDDTNKDQLVNWRAGGKDGWVGRKN